MKSELSRKTFIIALAILTVGFFLSVSTIEAQQTTKRKINKTTAQPPLIYPSQPIVEPTVISRAEDNATENQTPPVSDSSASVSQQQSSLTGNSDESVDDKINASNKRIKELNTRIKTLEASQKNEYDEKQKRLLLNLDILSRAEQRADALRKQLFDLIEKESSIKTRLDELDIDSRPENIERTSAFSGSLHPEEIRDQRKKSIDAEKKNLGDLLTQIQSNRTNLEQNVEKADLLVEKIRAKMEKDIDDALADDSDK